MVAAGFTVYFLDGYRSTPELSFSVRYKKCSCGIMVTASHNPPSDNAVKVYWSTGGQILPPHDKGIIERVMNVAGDRADADFDERVADGRQVVICQDEVDAAFIAGGADAGDAGPARSEVIYSPLHGVGASAVLPVLAGDGFTDVEVFGPHAKPDGDFPNVPGHVANPENPEVFDAIIARAQADRRRPGRWPPIPTATASAAPRRSRSPTGAQWRTLTGNQIGALLADYVLETRKAAGKLTPQHYIVETLVTTQLIRRIGDSYGVRTIGDLLVGFKWIAGAIDEVGPEHVRLRHRRIARLPGRHATSATRTAAVAAMLLCELAAKLKAAGQTLHEKLDALFWQHGYHAERTVSVQMPGSEGMLRMKEVMAAVPHRPAARSSPAAASRRSATTAIRPSRSPGGEPAAARRPEGRPGDPRPGDGRQLRRRPPQRHRAEDQVLHVHLRAARAAGQSRRRQARCSTTGCTRWKPTCGPSRACESSPQCGSANSSRPVTDRGLNDASLRCGAWTSACPATHAA